jgi:hypothetical protein
MAQERPGAARRLLIEMFQRERFPDGLPEGCTQEEISANFDAWLRQHSENEDVQRLWRQMMIEIDVEMLERVLSGPEGKAAGFRSIMRPNADGTLTRLWTKLSPDDAPPQPSVKDSTRN